MADDTATMSLDRYAPDAKALVVAAQGLADERRHAEIIPLHLLVRSLERDPGVKAVFSKAGVDVIELLASAERALDAIERSNEPSYLSTRFLDLLSRAEREARRERADSVQVEHLINALTQEVSGAAGELLGAHRLGPGALRGHMHALHAVPRPSGSHASKPAAALTDLVELARENRLDPVIGRSAELSRMLTVLERRDKSHPLLVGEAGIGKQAIVRALALRIATGDVPRNLRDVQLLSLDVGALVAGARLRGEIESRARAMLNDVAGRRAVLVIVGLEQLFGMGSSAAAVGDLLRSALASRQIRLLATTTPDGQRKVADQDPVLLRNLTVLGIEEPSVQFATDIVRGVTSQLEKHHHVVVSEGAIRASVTLAKRYAQDRFLPESALDLLDEACARKRVRLDGQPFEVDEQRERSASLSIQIESLEGATDDESKAMLTQLQAEHDALAVALEKVTRAVEKASSQLEENDVAETLALSTGIPVAKMLEGEAEKLTKMEERLSRRVVGQDDAVRAIARAIRRSRVGLRDPKKPIGSFLFLGPSGVGKTELAKALAEFLFDDEQALTRLDMSEFMERHMAQRLLGAPPGYADSERGGFLTEAVRQRPYSVLLFDEVEKAHQDVFNLLLQVLDDGRLTDGRGRSADFTNTVVIMTSNIGAERIVETAPNVFESPEGLDALRDVLINQLREFFRPEFLNRVGDTVVFRPLSKQHLTAIADIQLDRVRGLLAPRGVELAVSDAARDALVGLGYDPALGARPLQRVIVKHIQDPLAAAMLSGGARSGSTIQVDYSRDEFSIELSG